MSKIEEQLENLAATMNIHLIRSKRLDVSLNAAWHPTSRTILIRNNLDPTTRVCAIAHELGHAHYGHDCSDPRFERAADMWAAKQLLNNRVTPALLQEYRDMPGALAAELGVTPKLLQLWLDHIHPHQSGKTT